MGKEAQVQKSLEQDQEKDLLEANQEQRILELEQENDELKAIIKDMQEALNELAASKVEPRVKNAKPEIDHKGRTLVINIRRFYLENRGEITLNDLLSDEELREEILQIEGQQVLTFKP